MREKQYYDEINHIIKKLEINKTVRALQENNETLITYWNIGRLIVDAQGGKMRAKYGNELIKTWSKKLTESYGKGYDYTNLSRFRRFYLTFPNVGTVCQHLTWRHIRILLPIKNENKRNYYINLCSKSFLSVRDLKDELKNNAYERLLNKPEKIEFNSKNDVKYDLKRELKNPILIYLEKEESILKEKDLQMKILAKLQVFFF